MSQKFCSSTLPPSPIHIFLFSRRFPWKIFQDRPAPTLSPPSIETQTRPNEILTENQHFSIIYGESQNIDLRVWKISDISFGKYTNLCPFTQKEECEKYVQNFDFRFNHKIMRQVFRVSFAPDAPCVTSRGVRERATRDASGENRRKRPKHSLSLFALKHETVSTSKGNEFPILSTSDSSQTCARKINAVLLLKIPFTSCAGTKTPPCPSLSSCRDVMRSLSGATPLATGQFRRQGWAGVT